MDGGLDDAGGLDHGGGTDESTGNGVGETFVILCDKLDRSAWMRFLDIEIDTSPRTYVISFTNLHIFMS